MRIRSLLVIGALLALAGTASAERVVIVQPTVSLPNEAERNYARRLTAMLTRDLAVFGIEGTAIPDERVTSATLRGAAVAILPYNANLPDAELRALESFVSDGGKLLVFYSADADLARLMGFKLAPYQVASAPGQWAAFRFNKAAPPHLPERIVQDSHNIRPALPSSPTAHVIATWENAQGQPVPDAAWTRSPAGFWMAHVLLDDGDAWARQRLLLGLLADAAPGLWAEASAACLKRALHLRADGGDGVQEVAGRVDGSAAPDSVRSALREVDAARARSLAAQKAGNHTDAILEARAAHDALVRAYALTFSPRAGERCGVWDHSGAGLYPGDWARTCTELAGHGVQDLFVNLLWPGVAHYESAVLPRSATFRMHGDQAAACLAAAHARGMKVHAWKVCWRLESAPEDLLERFRQEGRLQVTDGGETLPWLCPSDPRNLQYEKDAVRELLTRYAVDGIHLDYIRYRDSHVCFCAGCRQRFEEFIGRTVTAWPDDVQRLPLKGRYETWRAGRISRLVQDVSSFGRRLRPNVEISAAVFGRYPLCARSVGQDWGSWLQNGLLDFACPMNYTEDRNKFAEYCRDQAALPGARARIFPGLGVTATESRLDAVAVLDQVEILRRAQTGGFVLFDLNQALVTDILPLLRLGVTAAGAPITGKP